MANEPPATPGRVHFGGAWAKIEIVLGLLAAGLGLLLGNRACAAAQWEMAAVGLVLFVLGGYLALAGQRSHVYRSNMESTARLVQEIRTQQGDRP